MSVTQTDVAKRVGMDVSSVNKILNRKPGAIFRKETIDHVFKTAKEMGYNFDRMIKGNVIRDLKDLVPANMSPTELRVHFHQLSDKQLLQIQKRIYRSA